MIILVGYTSIEGQTRKIAGEIASRIEAGGDRALLFDITSLDEYSVSHPEAAILCAPIHAGHYPVVFKDFVTREKAWLNSVPSAFVSVSLLIMSDVEEEREEARGFAETMKHQTGWIPNLVHHAAGALRFTEYDFFKRWMVHRMVQSRAGATDTTQDYEFTDWQTLNAFVDKFRAAAAS